MSHYIQFFQERIQGVVYYSTPPVGFHSALAAQRLAEHEAQVNALKDPADRAKHAPSLQILRDERDRLLRQEVEFMAKLAAEGLELYEVPETEIKDGIVQIEYEDIDPDKPKRGKRISRAFEARARTWRRLGNGA